MSLTISKRSPDKEQLLSGLFHQSPLNKSEGFLAKNLDQTAVFKVDPALGNLTSEVGFGKELLPVSRVKPQRFTRAVLTAIEVAVREQPSGVLEGCGNAYSIRVGISCNKCLCDFENLLL